MRDGQPRGGCPSPRASPEICRLARLGRLRLLLLLSSDLRLELLEFKAEPRPRALRSKTDLQLLCGITHLPSGPPRCSDLSNDRALSNYGISQRHPSPGGHTRQSPRNPSIGKIHWDRTTSSRKMSWLLPRLPRPTVRSVCCHEC